MFLFIVTCSDCVYWIL